MFRKKVKCCDCGFLGLYRIPPSSLYQTRADSETLVRDLGEELQAFQRIGLLGIYQCDKNLRQQIADGVYAGDDKFICTRLVLNDQDLRDKPADAICRFLNSERKCAYFFQYNPGYPPIQHTELQREAKTHRLLTRNMILAAIIGALAAVIIQLIFHFA